jgi:hypothetical protein
VTYEYNGADHFDVLDAEILNNPDGDVPYGIREDIFDAMVDAAVIERCAEDYGDWLSGQDGQEATSSSAPASTPTDQPAGQGRAIHHLLKQDGANSARQQGDTSHDHP